MGRFDPKYTPEQRAAVLEAVLDAGMSVPATLRAAQAGELAGLEPFEMKEGTARSYITSERRKRRGKHLREVREVASAEHRLDMLAGDWLSMAEHRTAQLKAKCGNGDLEAWEELRKIAGMARDIRALVRGLGRTHAGDNARRDATAARRPGEAATIPGAPDPAAQLIAAIQRDMVQSEQQRKRNGPATAAK